MSGQILVRGVRDPIERHDGWGQRVVSGTELATIVALARAGALDEALRRFEAMDADPDDPAALIVQGRLLKDQAARAAAGERRRLYGEAAAAYARSAQLRPATYPLINAATLTALAGDTHRACTLAEEVLRSIAAHPDEPETPYYRAATVAEALLLSGREAAARTALAEAISVAPQAWEDHATTLRQFGMILAAQGRDTGWLDAHRPPRSLHFGGHMAFDATIERRPLLDQAIRAHLDAERVGFGYGALAAGADIIVAEHILAHGAELHAILPGGPAQFAAASVDPCGMAWHRRFAALLARATTVRALRPLEVVPTAHAFGIANDIAMGAAAMNARRLESEAIQLLIVDDANSRGSVRNATEAARQVWGAARRRQYLVEAPREIPRDTDGRGHAQPGQALAVVAIAPARATDAVEPWLAALHIALAEGRRPLAGPYWSDGYILVAMAGLDKAAELAVRLAGQGHRVGADYIVARPFLDPFSGDTRLPTDAHGAAEAAARSTPTGSACVTEDFAAALEARNLSMMQIEFVGELDVRDGSAPLGLYALK